MARLGPWEHAPRLAVAVSGGADSLALAFLAHQWARERGGAVLAVTVDHALRPEAADEARQVGQWLAVHGIAHRIVRWEGDKPTSGIQEAARQARYGLLRQVLREYGILHLLLAHHRDDQAETLLQRLVRGSGVDGLSAMAACAPLPEGRLLRPLLTADKQGLRDYLRRRGQSWIEDPSNRSHTYQRVRIRDFLEGEGLSAERLSATAERLSQARGALERATADFAARVLCCHPGGYVTLDPKELNTVSDDIALRLLSCLSLCVSGAAGPKPRLENVERLLIHVRSSGHGRRSFGGCLWGTRRGTLFISREPGRMQAAVPILGRRSLVWDERFHLRLEGGDEQGTSPDVRIGGLGRSGVDQLRSFGIEIPVPSPVAEALPALWCAETVFAVPHLGYNRCGPMDLRLVAVDFAPSYPLAGYVRRLVSAAGRIMC